LQWAFSGIRRFTRLLAFPLASAALHPLPTPLASRSGSYMATFDADEEDVAIMWAGVVAYCAAIVYGALYLIDPTTPGGTERVQPSLSIGGEQAPTIPSG
jgi:hypothetical protein